MARMGVFSRNDDRPESVPRSLQLLTHRHTFTTEYMKIVPNFTEILYPNESISLQVTNFIRTVPMKRPMLSRVRVIQKFAAIPIRLLWQQWEDYIKGENDAQFLLEEPYIVNATDGAESTITRADGQDNIQYDGGFLKVTEQTNIGTNEAVVIDSRVPITPTTDFSGVSRRGILLDRNSFVTDRIVSGGNEVFYPDDTQRKGYCKIGVRELGDYLNHPLYVATGKNFISGHGEINHPFSAFKFAAYQLMYSYFERQPNVQTRVDDYYEMSQNSNTEFPSIVACVNPNNEPVPPDTYCTDPALPFATRVNRPAIVRAVVSNGLVTSYAAPRNCAANVDETSSTYRADVQRTSWENVEKFPLKSGANLSMLAWINSVVTGIPTAVPSQISLSRIRYANWQTDYFTSCNPWQQRGEEAQIPVNGIVKVGDLTFTANSTFVGDSTRISSQGDFEATVYPSSALDANLVLASDGSGYKLSSDNPGYSSGFFAGDNLRTSAVVDSVGDYTPSGSVVTTVNGVSATTPTVSGLYVSPSNFRFAMTLQHIKEMQAQIDNRFQSYIRKFFGARARDYRLDRPEFLGGSVMELNISDVTQNSETTDNSPLGDVAGKSVSADTSRTIRYHADEHTIIMGTMYIIPDTNYIGGLDRIDSTKDRFDWALPQFSHLSEQAVYNSELAYQGLKYSGINQEEVFGYEPVLNHLRWRRNFATCDFRDTLNSKGNFSEYKPWLMTRDFGAKISSNGFIEFETPTLSDKFLSGRYGRDNSNFDVIDDDMLQPFMVDSYFKERLVRIISTRGNVTRLGA